jgi:hypothetical protein
MTDFDGLRPLRLFDALAFGHRHAAAARSFFTRVLDVLGVQADPQPAQTFDPQLRSSYCGL